MVEARHAARLMGWEQAWNERLPEIDEQIIHFLQDYGGINADNLQRLSDNVRIWFDSQVPHASYDPDWQRAKSDPSLLQSMLEQRFSHLLHHRRLQLAVQEAPVVEE